MHIGKKRVLYIISIVPVSRRATRAHPQMIIISRSAVINCAPGRFHKHQFWLVKRRSRIGVDENSSRPRRARLLHFLLGDHQEADVIFRTHVFLILRYSMHVLYSSIQMDIMLIRHIEPKRTRIDANSR